MVQKAAVFKKPATSQARLTTNTRGKVVPAHLLINKRGKVVSKRASLHGKRAYENVMLWGDAVSKARKALGLRGFVPIGGKTVEGQELHAKAKEIYAGRGGILQSSAIAKGGCKSPCRLQQAKDQFKSCLIPTFQKETLELLSLVADAATSAANEALDGQGSLAMALADAQNQLQLLDATAAQVGSAAGEHMAVDSSFIVSAPPTGLGNAFRRLAAAFRSVRDSVTDEVVLLRAKAQGQQHVIALLKGRCCELEKKLVQADSLLAQSGLDNSLEALGHFRNAQAQRQQRMAVFFHSSAEAALVKLAQGEADFKIVEEQRQRDFTDFMRGEQQNEAQDLVSIQEGCQRSRARHARAAQEVHALHEWAKQLADESQLVMVDFVGEVNSSCDRIVGAAVQSVLGPQRQADALAAEADTGLSMCEGNVATAQKRHAVASEAQARERVAQDKRARASEQAMRDLDRLWQGAMKNYFPDPMSVVAGGA